MEKVSLSLNVQAAPSALHQIWVQEGILLATATPCSHLICATPQRPSMSSQSLDVFIARKGAIIE
jgi:hypothetical protein